MVVSDGLNRKQLYSQLYSPISHRFIADVHKMLLVDVHKCDIDMQMRFGHDWVQLRHMTMTRMMHVENPKWPPANVSFSSLSSQIFTYVAGIWYIRVKYSILE